MRRTIYWDLKCPECEFEFQVSFPEDESEENKMEIKTCPCGCKMNIVKEKGGGADA